MVGGTRVRLLTWWMLISLLASTAAAAPSAGQAKETVWMVGLETDISSGTRFLGAEVVAAHPVSGFLVVRTTDPDFPKVAARQPGVRYVEADGIVHASASTGGGDNETTDTNQTEDPDDPLWPDQYGVRQVDAPEAWNVTRGDLDVHLCIVDSGIAFDHEDIPSERIIAMRDLLQHDDDPQDGTGHGTHVASIAAARTDNALGIAGVADVSLLVVRVLDDKNSGRWSTVAAGIEWCTLNGGPRTIINLSLGGDPEEEPKAVHDAVALADDNGHLVVAAAGNRGCLGCIDFPARIPSVVAVGCTDAAAVRCTYSARGDALDLLAPGDAVVGADPKLGTAGYSKKSGTSMSTPHVSAAAALVWSHHPGLTARAVVHRLLSGSADFGAAGFETSYGHGLLDMSCALHCGVAPPTAPDPPTVSSTSHPGVYRIAWEIPDDPWSDYIEGYHVYTADGGTAHLIASVDADTHHIDYRPPILDDGRYHVAAVNSGGASALSDAGCRPLVWTPAGAADAKTACDAVA